MKRRILTFVTAVALMFSLVFSTGSVGPALATCTKTVGVVHSGVYYPQSPSSAYGGAYVSGNGSTQSLGLYYNYVGWSQSGVWLVWWEDGSAAILSPGYRTVHYTIKKAQTTISGPC